MSGRPTMATFRDQTLRDPDVRAAYDALSSRFEVKRRMIALRKKAGLAQERMADLLGTRKSNISRLSPLPVRRPTSARARRGRASRVHR